ncbi:MAG: tetratricopeptide repeat protein [Elusimicrobia bacterium]|nr:tetratricopeptide repeat protein [Elusimicrobiota bacterium]
MTAERRLGRLLFAAGLLAWGWVGLRHIPYCSQDPRYVISLEWGFWQNAEWVHPLFVPLLDVCRRVLGLFGYAGRMFVPVELMNLAVGGATLAGLYYAAEAAGGSALCAAAGALLLAYSYGFWEGALRADPYALAAASSAAAFCLLTIGVGEDGRRRFGWAGAAAGLAVGFHAAGLSLAPVAALAAWLRSKRVGPELGWFLGCMAVAVALAYAVFFAYHGITPRYFDRIGAMQMVENVQQVPLTSIYTSRDPAKQVRDFVGNVDYLGGKPLLAVGAALLCLGMATRLGREWLKGERGSTVILAAAHLLSYGLFFLINNTKNGFVYAGFLSLPLLFAATAGGTRASRLLFPPAALVLAWMSAGRVPAVGPGSDHIQVESRYLQGLLGRGGVALLPGCPDWALVYDRRLDFLTMGESPEQVETCIAPVVRPEALAGRVAETLKQGRRVFLLAGGRLREEREGARSPSHVFWNGLAEPAERDRAMLAIRRRLEGSFAMECVFRSPQGWEYCRLAPKRVPTADAVPEGRSGRSDSVLDRAQRVKGWAPSALRTVRLEEIERALEGLPASAGNFVRMRIGYLKGWLAESPDDVFAKYDLVVLAADLFKDGIRKSVKDRGQAIAMLDALVEGRPGNIDLRLERARLLTELGRKAEALRDLERTLALRPAEPELRRMQGMYRGLKEPGRVLATLDRLAELRASEAGPRIERGQELMEQGRRDEALGELNRALALRPSESELRQMQGMYHGLHDTDGGLAVLDRLVELRATDAGVHLERKVELMGRGLRSEAVDALGRLEELRPGDAGLRLERARVLKELGRKPEALQEMERALALLDAVSGKRASDAGLRVERAEVLSEMGRRSEALRELARAEELVCEGEALLRMEVAYRGLKEFGRALGVLETLARTRPQDAGVRVSRAEVLMHLGRKTEALESLGQAWKLGPAEPDLRRIGFLYRVLGEPRRALASLDALAKLRPRDGALQVERAAALLELGRKAEAREAFRLAEGSELTPADLRRAARGYQSLDECGEALKIWDSLVRRPSPSAKDFSDRAVCAYRRGDWEGAVSDLRRAIGLAPRELEAYVSLAAVYSGRGLNKQALAVYDRGLAVEASAGDGALRRQLAEGRALVLQRIGKAAP